MKYFFVSSAGLETILETHSARHNINWDAISAAEAESTLATGTFPCIRCSNTWAPLLPWAQGWGMSLGTSLTLDTYVALQWSFSNARDNRALDGKFVFRACHVGSAQLQPYGKHKVSPPRQRFSQKAEIVKPASCASCQCRYLSSTQLYHETFFCCLQSFSVYSDPLHYSSQVYLSLSGPPTQMLLFSQACSNSYLFPVIWKNLVFLWLLSELPPKLPNLSMDIFIACCWINLPFTCSVPNSLTKLPCGSYRQADRD